ncbi:MAG TPA: peptide-methionine (S)-S-oxide reductase MsrA [Candidatus Paenalcaligenes intestinipullorum]|uniref:Peptide methionine sulfoxide reductase MsrA n=1 Tax=Candidatus Paenalcaligenes intestinipullorum TaxID=2838718 RepID=A0A9D2RG39_9BURK|nr:peptide-methionine (S)-S-oxide reductase MsrA [Candidatus Paenalcaligenes intestinipullorum]
MMEVAVLGGGCFWCLEPLFSQLKGVEQVLPGYAGGHTQQPTYEEVCHQGTGHIEVVQIRFDPELISYAQLLEVFFAIHDPTTLDRQGNDVGPQYASVIFAQNATQQQHAEAAIQKLSPNFEQPIVTRVRGAERFWPAETIHHRYYEQNPQQGYCQYVIQPKLGPFAQRFKSLLKGSASEV